MRRIGVVRRGGRGPGEGGPVRRLRLVRRLSAFGAVVALAMTLAPSPAAHGVAVAGVGWWTATNQVGLLGPVNPTVPEGGMYVAAEVGERGPMGVSALRFDLDPGEVAEQLLLAVESAQGTPLVVACLPTFTWTPERGGPIASAPGADCARGSAFGTLSADGSVMAFPVSGLQAGEVVDVVLYPLDGASPFQISFRAPTAQSLAVAAGPTGDEGAENPGGQAFVEFQPSFATEVPTISDPAVISQLSGGGLVPTTAPAVTPTTAPAAGRARPARFTPPVIPDDRRARVASALMFANLVGLFLWTLRAPGHVPRALGPFAGARARPAVAPARGVGRFARPRVGMAPRV